VVFSNAIESGIFQTSTANPAQSGVLRLANSDAIAWRNHANGADITMSFDTSNNLNFANPNTFNIGCNLIGNSTGGGQYINFSAGDIILATYGGDFITIPNNGLKLGSVAAALSGTITFEGSSSGSCTLTAPAVAGTVANAMVFSNSITTNGGLTVGVAGTLSGVITLEGSSSGSCTITAPATAGTAANPFVFSNGINIPSGTSFNFNSDTYLSRGGSNTLYIGGGNGLDNGTVVCSTVEIATLYVSGGTAQFGTAGTTSGVITLEGSTSGSCTITAPATAGTSTNPITISNSIQLPSGTAINWNADTGISRGSAGNLYFGNGTAGSTACNIFANSLGISGNGATYGTKISQYNAVATAGWGVPGILGVVKSSGLTANYNAGSAKTIYTPTAASVCRITGSQMCTTAATTGAATSTFPSLTLGWTDVGGIARTYTLVTSDSNNTTNDIQFFDVTIYTNTSTAVTVTSASYASNTAAQMQYALAVNLEQLN